jgi:hypothetical protein
MRQMRRVVAVGGGPGYGVDVVFGRRAARSSSDEISRETSTVMFQFRGRKPVLIAAAMGLALTACGHKDSIPIRNGPGVRS